MMCEASVGAMNWNENFPKAELKKTKQIIFLRSQEKLMNCNENQVFTTCFSCLETFVSLESIRSKLVTFFFIAVALGHHIEGRLLQQLYFFFSVSMILLPLLALFLNTACIPLCFLIFVKEVISLWYVCALYSLCFQYFFYFNTFK